MKQIICSSKTLALTLEKFIVHVPPYEQGEDYKIYAQGKVLGIDDYQMEIESKEDWEFEYAFDKIKSLKKILKKIPEQPITITFNDGEIVLHQIHL